LSQPYFLIANDFNCNRGYRAEGAEHGAGSEELGARKRTGALASRGSPVTGTERSEIDWNEVTAA